MNFLGNVTTRQQALELVQRYPSSLLSLPDHLIDDQIRFAALYGDENLFKDIQVELLSEQVIQKLLAKRPEYVKYFVRDKLPRHIVIQLVSEDGNWIRYLPENRIDEELAIMAIEQNIDANQYIPTRKRSQNYLNRLITIDPKFIEQIPLAERDLTTMAKLVAMNGELIKWVPMADRSFEMCQLAMASDINNIQLFPEHIYDNPLMLDAIMAHPFFRLFSDAEVLAKQRENPAFSYNAVEIYPLELIRESLASRLVSTDVRYFPKIPHAMLTNELCQIAVGKNPALIIHVPKQLRIANPQLWEGVLQQQPALINFVENDELTNPIRIYKHQQALGKTIKL